MRGIVQPAVVLAGLAALAQAAVAQPTTIVVDYGAHPSAQVAGHAENAVGWGDADPTDDIVCTQAFAACELQHYLRLLTGHSRDFALADDDRLPRGNVILVGSPATNRATEALARELGLAPAELTGDGPEGYVLRSGQTAGRQWLVIGGGGRVGTLYGSYDLLHRLGVRWFAPGEVHEEVPRRPWVWPEVRVREQPDFLTRGFHAWEDRGDEAFLLWMARNRLNYWCVEQSQKGLLHKLGIMLVGGNHIITEYYLGPRLPYPYNHPAFTGDEDKPADPYAVSAEYRGDVNADGRLTYFEAHPEWYGLRGGKRSDAIHGDGGDNFCTTNEDALTEFMKNAIADLATGRFKDADIINAWTLDGGRWCECDRCKTAGTTTDRNLLFVHRYAQAIKQAQAEGVLHRPVRLLFLAYADVLAPPSRPLPPDFDYDLCIATYFPIVRCYVHDFDDPRCPPNASYYRQLQGWAQKPDRFYRGQLCIGEYYNVSGYKCLPACFMHTMANDIPVYYRFGARHFHYMHCTTGNWGNKALTNWQMARQLWDVDTNCQALWRDYFRARYGPAAGSMWRFYCSLEPMLSNVSDLKYRLGRSLNSGVISESPHLSYADDPTRLGPSLQEMIRAGDRCRAALRDAKAHVLPERVAARVAEDERLYMYGYRTLLYYDALCRAILALRVEERGVAKEALRDAQRLAAELKADTTSPSLSSSHASAPDALSASFAANAVAVIADALGPDEMPAFDPAQGPLIIGGSALSMGGGPLYGFGLYAFPGRVLLSEEGNYAYGAGTQPHDRLVGWFSAEKEVTGPVELVLTGMSCPEPIGGIVHGEVRLNDTVIHAGVMPFAERELTTLTVAFDASLLKEGPNRLEIRNTEPNGRVGGRPWFGVARVEVRKALSGGQ
ncbi:MAG: DUF4838 domain-containing protein [Armatimonadetes bacterium]|nr:DUF4838 domain-containing protein [Armatimonadota bacterium]